MLAFCNMLRLTWFTLVAARQVPLLGDGKACECATAWNKHVVPGRGGTIGRCGNGHLRKTLVEAAWHYRRPPLMSKELRRRNQGVAAGVRRIAWEAQKRLNKRLYHLMHAGKSVQKAVIALARELAGFIWAVGQEEALLEAV